MCAAFSALEPSNHTTPHGVEIGTPAGQALEILKKTLKESSLGGFESKSEICFYDMGDLSDLTKKQQISIYCF